MDFANGVHVVSFPEVRFHGVSLRLSLSIACTAGSGNTSIYNHTSSEVGARWLSGCTLTFDWEVEELIMISGDLKVSLHDADGNLEDGFMSQRFVCEDSWCLLERKRDGVWQVEHKGVVDFESVAIENGVVEFTARPLFERMANMRMESSGAEAEADALFVKGADTFPPDGGEVYYYSTKFFHADGSPYRIFLGNQSRNDVYRHVKLSDLLQKAFGVVDSAMSGSIYSDWVFAAAENLPGVEGGFNDLYVLLREAFMNQTTDNTFEWAASDMRELLKQLLFSLGMFGGMVSQARYFLAPMLDSGAFAVCDTSGLLMQHSKVLNSRPKKGLLVKSGGWVWYSSPAQGDMKDFYDDDIMEIAVRGNIFALKSGSDFHKVVRAKRNAGASYASLPVKIGEQFRNFYLSRKSARRDEFTLLGVEHEVATVYSIGPELFVPVALERDYEKNETKVTGIVLSEASEAVVVSGAGMPMVNRSAGSYYFAGAGTNVVDAGEVVPEAARVYVNGLRQRYGEDYGIVGTEIVFCYTLPVGANVTIDVA